MTNKKELNKSQRGNAVVIVLVVLAVVAVGALAYLSGQIKTEDEASPANSAVASAEPASGETAAIETTETEEGTDTAATETTDEAAETETPELAGAKIEPGNPVVAKVGDEEIMRLDVLNFITQLPPNVRQMPIEQLFPMALEQVVNTRIIAMNVDTDQVKDDETVQKQIEMAKEQILRNAYIEQEVEKKITEDKLKKAYKEQVTSQPDVEQVKAAHILVEDEAKAKELIAKLNEGADFAELAKENSTDGTAQTGGELGYFSKADVVPEFANAAFAMKAGDYSKEPVKTDFGFHVIKLEEKRNRPKPDFESSKPYLEQELRREVLEEIMQDWQDDVKVVKYDINGKPVEEKSN